MSDTRWRKVHWTGTPELGHQRGVVDGLAVVRVWSRRYRGWRYVVISESERVAGLWRVEKEGDTPSPPWPEWATPKEGS